jgi:hypothetical protein
MTNITRVFGENTLQKYRLAAAFTVIFAACLSTSSSAASSDRVISARYGALQSFSQQFGSKLASGYFVREIDRCLVTLKIAEKGNAESQSGQAAAQVRLVLNPGQMAGLDSEEGQSLNLTCSTNATVLILDSGGNDALMATQKRALSDNDFSEFVIP